jgi:hypothetical protein
LNVSAFARYEKYKLDDVPIWGTYGTTTKLRPTKVNAVPGGLDERLPELKVTLVRVARSVHWVEEAELSPD